jgi:hypothetical protein
VGVEGVVEGLFDSVGWEGRLVGGWNSRCGSYLKRGGVGIGRGREEDVLLDVALSEEESVDLGA